MIIFNQINKIKYYKPKKNNQKIFPHKKKNFFKQKYITKTKKYKIYMNLRTNKKLKNNKWSLNIGPKLTNSGIYSVKLKIIYGIKIQILINTCKKYIKNLKDIQKNVMDLTIKMKFTKTLMNNTKIYYKYIHKLKKKIKKLLVNFL